MNLGLILEIYGTLLVLSVVYGYVKGGITIADVFYKSILVSAPLAGHLKVDVHDAAWTIFNIGILGLDFTVFKAELCFKGKVEYDLNILGVCDT